MYGTVTDVNANNVPTSALIVCPATNTNCPATYYAVNIHGNQAVATAGITLNFLRLPVVKLGLDVRGSLHFGTNGVDTALGGLKLTIHPPFLNIRPYLQGSVGYLGTTATDLGSASVTETTTHANYVATEVFAGLDLPLLPILDLRVLEIGAGHAINSVDSTKPTFVTASAGLVLHF